MSMIHTITAAVPRYKRGLRKGRGESSGHGKTSGRGNKGAGARQGGPHWKTGHEGGQTPLHRRLPARGFSNAKFERNWYIVNVSQLERFADGATVDASALIAAKLIPDVKSPVKILGDGELTKKLTVIAGWYSKSAHEKIIKAGGTAQGMKGGAFQFPKPKPKWQTQLQKGPQAKKGKSVGEAPAQKAEKPAEKAAEKPVEKAEKPAETPQA
jgi:large subunit ribosomal protein L15